jgi:hypothetical protein
MPPSSGPPPWPRWLVVLVSVPIVYHLSSVILGALAAPSGPWPTPDGPAPAGAPPAVVSLHESAAQPYLRATRLTHNSHFPSNRVGTSDAYLEVRLENEAGQHVRTVRLPDPHAPPMVRQRQAQLIRALVEDQPVAPPASERIYPPNQLPPTVPIWDITQPGRLALVEVVENEIPRNRPAYRPTAWSLLVVRSCARHLCRVHGASHARVIRYSRDPISPEVLLSAGSVPESIDELVSDYGRFPR